jgi:beta-mannosidase
MDPTRKIYPQEWLLGMHPQRQAAPQEWVPAHVPGAVQLDWGAAHDYPEYTYSDNYKAYAGFDDQYWTYKTHLDFPPLAVNERLFFVCGGVDYRFQVGCSERILHDQEGMFTPFEIELTGAIQPGDEFWVCIYPAPKSFRPDPDINDRERQRGQADHSCKPAVSYGWDFHPRLIPLGIWQETHLEIRPPAFLSTAILDYRLNSACDRADINVRIDVNGEANGQVRWELLDPNGTCVFARTLQTHSGLQEINAVLENPHLWWPHDQGAPMLYTSRVILVNAQGQPVDSQQQRIGFRRVRLVMNEGEWRHPAIYPKSRSHAPMTLEINGRRIFAKGSNWVSPHIFPGLLGRETYQVQLGFAKQANMNLLRCWGGACVMKEPFFDLCDELGIMVWQEFPLACNDYPDNPDYLHVLDQESRSIIGRLKPHPCVVLWCGGNELFNEWSGMDEQSLPLRLLDSNCYHLDPERPFIMTSPLDGVGHGSYFMIDWSTNREAWSLFQEGAYTAYCEFSASSSLRDVQTLRRFIPEEEMFPLKASPAWVAHRAVNVNGRPLHLPVGNIEHYCGKSSTIEELVENSQFVHGQAIRGIFEEVRRQKMRASMALNWCFNEPWPNAAGSGNLVDWYNQPLPVLWDVAAALRPVLASARMRTLKWQVGELFNPEIWILSDTPKVTPPGKVMAWLQMEEGEPVLLLEWQFPEIPASDNLRGPVAQVVLPDSKGKRFKFILKVSGRPELDSEYILALAKGNS